MRGKRVIFKPSSSVKYSVVEGSHDNSEIFLTKNFTFDKV